ncbi:MAG: sulfatase [Rubripirellula sp.]
MTSKLVQILFLIACFPFGTVQAAKPNIVLFFVDDFGQRDLSCYGSTLYETPHMDKLAAEGMLFTNAYSAYPRCVPSRQGLLSGKYPARVRFQADKAGSREHQLPLSEVTFGEALQEFGYQTCYIGKWHLGHDGGDPGAQGFQTVIHAGSAGATGSYFFPFPTEKGNSVVNPVSGKDGDYLTDRLTDKAVDYIASRQGSPFLLVMAHYAVHTPMEAPQETTQKYRDKLRKSGIDEGGKKEDADLTVDRQGVVKTVQNNPVYAAMVERTDDSLGRIMQALNDAGIGSSTAIILTSDHGGLSTRGLQNNRSLATSNAPFRQGKGSIFEGGTRVPLIVKWPGKVAAAKQSAVQVTGTDHYPTMLEIAGAPLRPKQHLDGHSYLKALTGESYQRPGMFWYKWQARPDSTGDTRALSYVEGDYKVVQWIDEDLVELFDLSHDEGEQNNLAIEMPERTTKMLAKLISTEQSVGNLREKGRKELERRLQKLADKKKTRKRD